MSKKIVLDQVEGAMIVYPKINNPYKRSEDNKSTLFGEYTKHDYKQLENLEWVCTEKIDGANIRVGWDGEKVSFAGRSNNAQIPVRLYEELLELFPVEKFRDEEPMVLFGEGFGAGIQKGGKYLANDKVSFILFDVYYKDSWLPLVNVEGVAKRLGIKVVPRMFDGTLGEFAFLAHSTRLVFFSFSNSSIFLSIITIVLSKVLYIFCKFFIIN
jgi:hypothetical protein